MNSNDKNRFDALAEIKRSAFARVEERRRGEWQLTLSIWTGLAGLLALMLKEPEAVQPLSRVPSFAFLALGSILLLLHGSFLRSVGKRHDVDRSEASEAAKEMAKLANVEEPSGLKGSRALDWSRRVQFGISVLLSICLFCLLLIRTHTFPTR